MISICEYLSNLASVPQKDTKIEGIDVSKDIFTKCFACDTKKCHGACCAIREDIDIDRGAELQENEVEIIKEISPMVEKYLPEESVKKIKSAGPVGKNKYGKPMVQLVNHGGVNKCIYAIKEDGCWLCAIQKAYNEGNDRLKDLDFPKPVSCHLFPIVVDGNHLVYERDEECRTLEDFDIPLYITQKAPLIRKFGIEWYRKLTESHK